MPVSSGFKDFVLDQLSTVGEVRPKAMFGAVGLYLGEFFFGVLADDTLYLKADDHNRAMFEKARSAPFKPYADRPDTMQYYFVPLSVLEDVDLLTVWAKSSVDAAKRKSARRVTPKTRKKR